MQSSTFVIEPALDISLVTLYEVKTALGLGTSNDQALDDQLELFIKWASAEVAIMCNRVFAKETVEETYLELDGNGSERIFLSHYPVIEIESIIDSDGAELEEDVDYNLDMRSGKLTRLGGVWTAPVSITYTGGYELPNDSPIALQRACTLMAKESYTASSPSGGAAVRMVAHKESRIMYYDPNKSTTSSSSSSGGGSPAMRAASDLLKHFTRYWV